MIRQRSRLWATQYSSAAGRNSFARAWSCRSMPDAPRLLSARAASLLQTSRRALGAAASRSSSEREVATETRGTDSHARLGGRLEVSASGAQFSRPPARARCRLDVAVVDQECEREELTLAAALETGARDEPLGLLHCRSACAYRPTALEIRRELGECVAPASSGAPSSARHEIASVIHVDGLALIVRQVAGSGASLEEYCSLAGRTVPAKCSARAYWAAASRYAPAATPGCRGRPRRSTRAPRRRRRAASARWANLVVVGHSRHRKGPRELRAACDGDRLSTRRLPEFPSTATSRAISCRKP